MLDTLGSSALLEPEMFDFHTSSRDVIIGNITMPKIDTMSTSNQFTWSPESTHSRQSHDSLINDVRMSLPESLMNKKTYGAENSLLFGNLLEEETKLNIDRYSQDMSGLMRDFSSMGLQHRASPNGVSSLSSLNHPNNNNNVFGNNAALRSNPNVEYDNYYKNQQFLIQQQAPSKSGYDNNALRSNSFEQYAARSPVSVDAPFKQNKPLMPQASLPYSQVQNPTMAMNTHNVYNNNNNNFPMQQIPNSRMNSMNMGFRNTSTMPTEMYHSQQNQPQRSVQPVYNASSIPNLMTDGMNGRIYMVQFKCCVRHFILGPQAHPGIAPGDFVVVEADRGEDIGVVTDIYPMKTFIEKRVYNKGGDEEENVIGRIVRLASVAERQLLPEKFHDEENILQFCRELSYNTYRLPMAIQNVEYQFDRHKLIVYYVSDSRVDFREFVRDLFSAYKARIWMKKINVNRPIHLEQWATVSLATGMQINK